MLRAIGELDAESARGLVAMEPKLRQVYGMDGGWTEIVAAQMALPDDMPKRIGVVWEHAKAQATAAGAAADPLEFTRTFVDTNFPG